MGDILKILYKAGELHEVKIAGERQYAPPIVRFHEQEAGVPGIMLPAGYMQEKTGGVLF